MFLGVGDGIGPVLGALGQAGEIGDADGSFVREEGAGQLPRRGFNDGRGQGGGGAAGLAGTAVAGFLRGPFLPQVRSVPSPPNLWLQSANRLKHKFSWTLLRAGLCPAGRVRAPVPTWIVMTAKYDSILESDKSYCLADVDAAWACISRLTRSTSPKTRSRFPPRILWISFSL